MATNAQTKSFVQIRNFTANHIAYAVSPADFFPNDQGDQRVAFFLPIFKNAYSLRGSQRKTIR